MNFSSHVISTWQNEHFSVCNMDVTLDGSISRHWKLLVCRSMSISSPSRSEATINRNYHHHYHNARATSQILIKVRLSAFLLYIGVAEKPCNSNMKMYVSIPVHASFQERPCGAPAPVVCITWLHLSYSSHAWQRIVEKTVLVCIKLGKLI
jgi:hypothetical protein